jgi:hypothetical protein
MKKSMLRQQRHKTTIIKYFLVTLHELLVRLAALPALHTNNGHPMMMQRLNEEVYATPTAA